MSPSMKHTMGRIVFSVSGLKTHGFADNLNESAREPLVYPVCCILLLHTSDKMWMALYFGSLKIPLVASLHILGHLEENSDFSFARMVLSFGKQIKLLEDCAQQLLVFVVALYSSKTLLARIVTVIFLITQDMTSVVKKLHELIIVYDLMKGTP